MAAPKKSAARTVASAPAQPPAQVFRAAISGAKAQGAALEKMVLQLTLGDESKLRRDRSIPLEDISFSDGEMRFLGVRVVAAEASALVIAAE